ncbi:hypothetical protein [Gottfriedia acidiceleris]|uniref:hypothetical protein n=1 Tax=Gottfriedia acidiceleris TaxID=371036 RepID=UPI003D2264E4
MLLSELLKEFMFHAQIKGHTPRTLKTRKTNLTAFNKFMENDPASHVRLILFVAGNFLFIFTGNLLPLN